MKFLKLKRKLILNSNEKAYFISDIHLGFPNFEKSLEREIQLVKWINEHENDMKYLFLLGDIYDYWIEYKNYIPKYCIHLLSKLNQLAEKGVEIYYFKGNHEPLFGDYFTKYIGIKEVFYTPRILEINNKTFFLAHGNHLKIKNLIEGFMGFVINSKFSHNIIRILHPEFVRYLANKIFMQTQHKRLQKDLINKGDKKEISIKLAKEISEKYNINYVIFGHRHYAIEKKFSENNYYINLGEWIFKRNFGQFDGENFVLNLY